MPSGSYMSDHKIRAKRGPRAGGGNVAVHIGSGGDIWFLTLYRVLARSSLLDPKSEGQILL